MKRTSNPLRFDSIFCAVSTSLLLATPVETFAFDLQDDPTSPVFCNKRRSRSYRSTRSAPAG